MPSLYGASRWQPLREDERVTAGAFGNEPSPKDLEAGFLEPGDVGRTISMAPVHRRSKPVVFGAGPGTGSYGREQIPTGSEPPVDVFEDGGLLFQRDMDDGIERDDGGKRSGRKFHSGHISAVKMRRRNQPASTRDLDRWRLAA